MHVHVSFAAHVLATSNLSSLLLLLLANADVQVANDPAKDKEHQEPARKSQRLPELGGRRVFVGDDEVALTELVDYIDGDEVEGRASNCVHESSVEGSFIGDERNGGFEVGDAGIVVSARSSRQLDQLGYLHGTLGQNHAGDNAFIFNTLGLTRALKERNLQDKLFRLPLHSAEHSLEVGIPASLEAVIPATVQRVSGLKLKVCFALVGPEARGRNVSDIVNEVCVD